MLKRRQKVTFLFLSSGRLEFDKIFYLKVLNNKGSVAGFSPKEVLIGHYLKSSYFCSSFLQLIIVLKFSSFLSFKKKTVEGQYQRFTTVFFLLIAVFHKDLCLKNLLFNDKQSLSVLIFITHKYKALRFQIQIFSQLFAKIYADE